MPLPIGSPITADTIGITAVACFAARVAGVPWVTMTSTFRRRNSAAISAGPSLRPAAQRYSMTMVRPSIQPSACSRCTKAATHSFAAEAVIAPRNPITGIVGCCARASSGHAAAPPSTVMNSRRLKSSIGLPSAWRRRSVYRRLNLNAPQQRSRSCNAYSITSIAKAPGPQAWRR